jgi:hypothetical protein
MHVTSFLNTSKQFLISNRHDLLFHEILYLAFFFSTIGNSVGKILFVVVFLSDDGNVDDNKRVDRRIFLVKQVDVLIDNK